MLTDAMDWKKHPSPATGRLHVCAPTRRDPDNPHENTSAEAAPMKPKKGAVSWLDMMSVYLRKIHGRDLP